MSIKQDFVIICESAVIDKQTNNLYLLGLFDNIKAPTAPTVHPKFCVATKFDDGEGTHKHKIVIRHESVGEIARLEGNITFGSERKAQYIGTFVGLPLAQFGEYFFEIYIDEILQPLTGSFTLVRS